ncbi:hypothetical protein [Methylobacterium sp. D48H]
MAIRGSSLAGAIIPVGGPAGLPGKDGKDGVTPDVSGLLPRTGDGTGLSVTVGGTAQALPVAIGARVLSTLVAASIVIGPAPAAFLTVQAALASLDGQIVGRTGQIVIQPTEGFLEHASTVALDRFDADRIRIQGPAPTVTTLTGVTSVTGGAGAWAVTATFGSTTGMAIGGLVQITQTVGASPLHVLHRGAWRVASITNGTTAVLTNTAYNQTPPTGVTGTATINKARLRFAVGVNAFDMTKLGGLSNVDVLGQFTNDGTIGVWNKSNANGSHGTLILGPSLAVAGFGADGVRGNYGGSVTATSVIASSCGNNGFMARDSGQGALIGCIGSGNGAYNPGGGGNGLLSQNASSVYAGNFEGYGNAGAGQFARTGASILNQNGQSARVVGNAVGFSVVWGYLQDETGIAAYNGTDYYNDNGRLFVPAASSSNAQGNAVSTINNGVTTANGGFTVTAPLYNAFIASTGGRVDASGSNVVSVGGTPYYEDLGGTIVSTGAVGMSGRFSVEAGRIIKSVSATPYTTNVDLTATIPLDDTVPQSNEGTQILTLTITPTSASSKIRLRFRGEGSKSAAGAFIGAIFRSGQAGAIRPGYVQIPGANATASLTLEVDDAPATTSPVTYTVNVGADSGALRLNGSATQRFFGGTAGATLVAEEIKV